MWSELIDSMRKTLSISEEQLEELHRLLVVGSVSGKIAKIVAKRIAGTSISPSNYMESVGLIQLSGIVPERMELYPLFKKYENKIHEKDFWLFIFKLRKGINSPQMTKQALDDYKNGLNIFGI